jgi:superfamily II DNA or RNA helicase
LATRGLIKFIENGGKAMMICGVEFTSDDIKTIQESYSKRKGLVDEKLANEVKKNLYGIEKDSLEILAWMIKNEYLDIKVAVKKKTFGIFHSKFGICRDKDSNVVAFEGSANETVGGLVDNRESLSLDVSWNEDKWSKQRILEIEYDFDRLWANLDQEYDVFEFPEAVKKELVKKAPQSIPSKEPFQTLTSLLQIKNRDGKIKLRDYQMICIDAWIKAGGRGIIEMATGTGKTYTSIASIGFLESIFNLDQLFIIVTCPYTHLVDQWQKSLEDFGYESIRAYSNEKDWKRVFTSSVYDINNGLIKKFVVVTTHNTFSSEFFINTVKKIKVKIMLIADEVHAVGSELRSQGLIENYDFRMGLSATPERYFDDEGTKYLYKFFGPTVMEFSLKDAIENGFLVPYNYYPYYVELSGDELNEYRKITKKIAINWNDAKNDFEKENLLNLLKIQRQKIVVNAKEKITKLQEILRMLGHGIDHCLIYCSDVQLSEVLQVLNKLPLMYQKITYKEDVETRNEYLKQFDQGLYKIIVAMNVLDEGVDIPSTRMAIILASSGNPKQYIQRRGRILRKYRNKKESTIYDILVIPPLTIESDDDLINTLERKIVSKELKRHEEMAALSLNYNETKNNIENIKRKYQLI